MTEVSAFIGLGSNLDDPQRQVRNALAELAELPASRVSVVSSLYRSPALQGPGVPRDQPDYINGVARLETVLAAEALLDALQAIEVRHGRARSAHWGPRTLDLDILLYGDRRIDTPRLRVPHPGLAERHFVLQPLAEIAPDLDIPGLGPLRGLLARCPAAGLERLDNPAGDQ